MKDVLSHIHLLILLVLLCIACQTESEEESYVVGVSQCTLEGTWRQSMLLDMQVKASEYPNLSLLVENAADSSALQVEQIRSLIERKVDLLIVSANEAEPVTPVVEEAYRAGIPVVLVDRKINSEAYTTYIGGDNTEVGRRVGYYVNNQSEGKPLTVLEIWGLPGSSAARERHGGFEEVLNRNIRIRSLNGRWKPEVVEQELMRMDSLDKVDVVYAHNDVMALAARKVIERRFPGRAKQVLFVGIDALSGDDGGLKAIIDGRLSASIFYPTGGSQAIRVAMRILSGETVFREYMLSSALVDSENAGTMFIQSEQVLDYQHQIEQQRQNLAKIFARYDFLRHSVGIILLLMGLLLLSALYMFHIIRNYPSEKPRTQAEEPAGGTAEGGTGCRQPADRKDNAAKIAVLYQYYT